MLKLMDESRLGAREEEEGDVPIHSDREEVDEDIPADCDIE